MNRLNKGISFLLKSSHFERLRMIRIVYIVIKAYFFVTFMPTKYYYNIFYFGRSKKDADLQPFRKEIRLIKKVGQTLPIKVTCLMESMAIQEYLKQYNFVTPISLGVKKYEGISAHAWISESKADDYNDIFK